MIQDANAMQFRIYPSGTSNSPLGCYFTGLTVNRGRRLHTIASGVIVILGCLSPIGFSRRKDIEAVWADLYCRAGFAGQPAQPAMFSFKFH